MAEFVLDLAKRFGFTASNSELRNCNTNKSCLSTKDSDGKYTFEVIKDGSTEDEELKNCGNFLMDMQFLRDSINTVTEYATTLRNVTTFIPVLVTQQQYVKFYRNVFSQVVVSIKKIHEALADTAIMSKAQQNKMRLREQILRTVNGIEIIAKSRKDFCKQLDGICSFFANTL